MLRNFDYTTVPSPSYVCFESALRRNCQTLNQVKEKSNAKILLALKGFAFTSALDIVMEYLDGFTCSGLWEALLASRYTTKERIHTYAPAFGDDFEQISLVSSHIVFNSPNMLKRHLQSCKSNKLAIRCNPGLAFAPVDLYNPCSDYSRFGVRSARELDDIIEHLDGLTFHALCEENADSLESVVAAFEQRFGDVIGRVRWVNFGGGHHITKDGYDIDKLIKIIDKFSQKWGVQVILEPGEAVGLNTGVLVSSVLDVLHYDKNIAVLDTSAEAHMPDTIIMPYTSEILGAKALCSRYELNSAPHSPSAYILAGNTCLSGDVMGYYEFGRELCIGDRVVFDDQIHYSIVKNTTFNGIKLPSLVLVGTDGQIKSIKHFDFEDYARRN